MEKPIETIEIDERTRYAIYPDYYSWDYLSEYYWEGLGVFTLRKSNWSSDLELDTLRLNYRLRTINESYYIEDKQEAMAKAITRAGYNYKFVEITSYPSYWHDLVIYWDEKQITGIDGVIDELDAWYKGEVYVVALEKLETYVGTHRSIEEWEVVESVGQVLSTRNFKFDLATCDELLGVRSLA